MFVTVKLTADLQIGTFVCHDSNNTWRQATSSDIAPLGVVRSTFTDDESVVWGEVMLSGACLARSSASVPDQGGWLSVDDSGRAIVGPAEDCGLIAPLSRGQASRVADELILVFIR